MVSADPTVPMSPLTVEPGQGWFMGAMGLGVATAEFDLKGKVAPYPTDSRFVQLVTGFQGRWGVWNDLEAGWQAPVFFNVFGSTIPGSSRVSGGGLGDLSGWLKFRWWQDESWSSAVWIGGKLPTGIWTGLDPVKSGADKIGTGSQDWFAGLAWKAAWGGTTLYFNVSYHLTGLKAYRDASGTLIEQDDGDITSVIAGGEWALTPEWHLTVPIVFENANRVRQNDVRLDDSDIQWLALRPSCQVRVTREVVLEPFVEYPLRGKNRRRDITLQLNFRYEF